MECSVHYRLTGPGGEVSAEGDGKASVGEDSLALIGNGGDRTVIPFRRVDRISESGRELTLSTLDGERLSLTKAGFKHDDLRRALMRSRNALMLRDRLIDEKVLRQPVRAAYEIRSGGSSLKGEGEVSLYERSLIFSPLDGQMFRVKLGLISKLERAEHRLVLHHRHGSLELFRMGAELDPFAGLVSKALAALKEEAGALLKEVHPDIGSSVLAQATDLLLDGRAASGKEVKPLDNVLWKALEERVKASGLREEFELLTATSGDHARIGVGRNDDGSGYIWFLAPMAGASGDPKVIAFEAESSGEQGRATYLFSYGRMSEFAGYDDTSAVTDVLGECLRSIGLRREPIMMSDGEMHKAENARYLNALHAMPELVALRKAFIGRAIHDENWKDSVQKAFGRA
jgi:hypothetical protein